MLPHFRGIDLWEVVREGKLDRCGRAGWGGAGREVQGGGSPGRGVPSVAVCCPHSYNIAAWVCPPTAHISTCLSNPADTFILHNLPSCPLRPLLPAAGWSAG